MLCCLRRLNIQIAKERELAYETDVLQGEMENLKRFVPLTRQPGQLGFLEYTPAVVPSSGAAHSKHDRVRPDTVCYYGSDNTDSETALQFSYAKLEVGQNWLPYGDHSRKEATVLPKRDTNSSSCEVMRWNNDHWTFWGLMDSCWKLCQEQDFFHYHSDIHF
ncbi:hypothetical protein HanRHA438_Chr01g0041431 [Helianthus annuus]|uniref:Uncharacterized protein n=1 Tax=Helianthus annuus TaxID=4232 RepID=A0A9K3JZS7_HELAN|nr:hypothetical protein HanXRQr2_Chr01g0040581 [Helianthus annuus]KAJ0624615.1 hypothetical protein HanIR_Chr01g0044961 [Helianthus annuus]KAJ0628346.1 hypothetical protein HanHA89_Chr01g0035601 [Helianthus annuus]KAJ0784631.1 hypothetical protein HanLR1_Chr01g0034091 [Helianthus annuus]KAJ0949695.1 hypothetical protein HanRHA438_Chr01g0041431 [Helianthus annuus]